MHLMDKGVTLAPQATRSRHESFTTVSVPKCYQVDAFHWASAGFICTCTGFQHVGVRAPGACLAEDAISVCVKCCEDGRDLLGAGQLRSHLAPVRACNVVRGTCILAQNDA